MGPRGKERTISAQRRCLRQCEDVLFPNATLADLYDADAMPPKLRKAHRDLDSAIDNLYKRGGFGSFGLTTRAEENP